MSSTNVLALPTSMEIAPTSTYFMCVFVNQVIVESIVKQVRKTH